MKEYDFDPCACQGTREIDPANSSHYQTCFIPTGWSLDYDTLVTEDKPRSIIIEGKCSDCGKAMRYPIPLAANFTGGTFLEHIYERMEHARPLAHPRPDGAYTSFCGKRSEWYEAQDHMSRYQRNRQFLGLFHTKDRAFVRRWLYESKPTYDDKDCVLHETGAEFFLETLRAAQKAGELEKCAPYVQWVEKEQLPEETELTCGKFEFLVEMQVSDSGNYASVKCFLKGKFDDSGRSRLELGTLCSASKGRESVDAVAELAAVLCRHASNHFCRNKYAYMGREEFIQQGGVPPLLEAIDPSVPEEDDEFPF